MVYIYCVGNKGIRVTKGLKYKLVDIENASYWLTKRYTKTWEESIKRKYPNAKICKAKIKLKLFG